MFIVLLIPCLVALEAGFHTELKDFSFCSSRYILLLSSQYRCFPHIFSQIKVIKLLFSFSKCLFTCNDSLSQSAFLYL
jgi:hypothetical protein